MANSLLNMRAKIAELRSAIPAYYPRCPKITELFSVMRAMFGHTGAEMRNNGAYFRYSAFLLFPGSNKGTAFRYFLQHRASRALK
jgi:hypothetical protein